MPRINHDDFVRGLAADLGINLDESSRIVRAFVSRLKTHLAEMDNVRLSCFGEFTVRLKETYTRTDTFRKGDNGVPMTYVVPRKLVPSFRFTESAREDINSELKKVI